MAKQKNQIEDIEAPVEGAETFQDVARDTVPNAPQSEPQAPAASEKRETKPMAAQPDSFTLDVLKSFPTNESLYVDKHGGAFTADTPKSIRGGAVLYKNPFYKQ